MNKKKIKNKPQREGTVFLPKKRAKQLLEMLEPECFGSDYVFFEPFCGIGNITCEIVGKQFFAYQDKIEKEKDYSKIEEWGNISAIRTIQNLYAIDINKKFISICRKRVLNTINFYLGKIKNSGKAHDNSYFQDFLWHGIKYHVHENEMLSCLKEGMREAEKEANKTRLSKEWFKKNGHKPLNLKRNFTNDYVYMNEFKNKH